MTTKSMMMTTNVMTITVPMTHVHDEFREHSQHIATQTIRMFETRSLPPNTRGEHGRTMLREMHRNAMLQLFYSKNCQVELCNYLPQQTKPETAGDCVKEYEKGQHGTAFAESSHTQGQSGVKHWLNMTQYFCIKFPTTVATCCYEYSTCVVHMMPWKLVIGICPQLRSLLTQCLLTNPR